MVILHQARAQGPPTPAHWTGGGGISSSESTLTGLIGSAHSQSTSAGVSLLGGVSVGSTSSSLVGTVVAGAGGGTSATVWSPIKNVWVGGKATAAAHADSSTATQTTDANSTAQSGVLSLALQPPGGPNGLATASETTYAGAGAGPSIAYTQGE